MVDYKTLFSRAGSSLQPNAIRKLSKMLGKGDVISLAAGAPSSHTFPTEELAEIAARVIRDQGQIALQYGPTRGQANLVEAVVEILLKRGINTASSDQLVMTTGSQQGLDLAARVIIDPGDVALVELPSYIGGIIALHNAQAELVGVRQDDGGIDLNDLRDKIESVRRSRRRLKCIYTITNFQNPSGVTLAPERREALVEIADEYDLLIIEDDPYFDIHFSHNDTRPRPLAALCPSRVIYLSSFSKVLAPGLRSAFVCAPEPLSLKIECAKEGADLSSSVLDQVIVAEALRTGLIERRLPEIRAFYEVRCRAMLDALERHAPDGSRWTRPVGGFFVLMEVVGDFDATESLPRAIESGAAYVPGQPFFVDGSGASTLRLAFSKETPERLARGIELICSVMRRGNLTS
jgi:2-aminoadipate transaminase